MQKERVNPWRAEMDAELLRRAKMQDIEREINRIRLAAAAKSARPDHRRAAPGPKPCAVPAMPLRLLRALRLAS
jgi:hypothetical protein